MDLAEWTSILEQLARERQALNGSYADLQTEMEAAAAQARSGVKNTQDDLIALLVQLNVRLGNYVNLEQEQSQKLWRLVVDLMERLAEAYDLALPPDWRDAWGDLRRE